MKFLLFILFFYKFTQIVSIGTKLTLELYPSLYEHPLFSYEIDVQCLVENGQKWRLLYGSIWKNIPSHPIARKKDGKTVETVIFTFENLMCRQFDVLAKVLKWTVSENSAQIMALAAGTGATVYYDELLVKNDHLEHQIDLGKHFFLNITPRPKEKEFYEAKLHCSENMQLILYFKIDEEMCLMRECSKMIFLKEKVCPTDEYDITIWKWKNAKEKALISRKKMAMFFPRQLINEGQGYTIHYDTQFIYRL